MSAADRAQGIALGIALDGRYYWTKEEIRSLIGDEPIEVQREVLLRMPKFSLDQPRQAWAKKTHEGLWNWARAPGWDQPRGRYFGEGSSTPLVETHIDSVLAWLNAPALSAPASQ